MNEFEAQIKRYERELKKEVAHITTLIEELAGDVEKGKYHEAPV